MTQLSEYRPDVVSVHPASSPNPWPKGILVLKCWFLPHSARHLLPPFDFKTASHQTSHPLFSILHPEPLLLKKLNLIWSLQISSLFAFQYILYIPVYFPERLGCHDLKSIWSDLHPCSSRIQPTSSLCALANERTAVSSTSCAPCCDSEGRKLDFTHFGAPLPPDRCTYELYPPQRRVQIGLRSPSPALVSSPASEHSQSKIAAPPCPDQFLASSCFPCWRVGRFSRREPE